MRILFEIGIDMVALLYYNKSHCLNEGRNRRCLPFGYVLHHLFGERKKMTLNFFANATFSDPFETLPLELNYILKILIGGLLGMCMGIERSRRQKEAGIATHFVVGCAATLLTCISLWFKEIGSDYNAAARIAAQIVSGIGFLGAGMIFFRRESLRGLTTAAGIWATAAIGMCVATGMFWLALGATVVIICFQILFHCKLIKRNSRHILLVKFEYTNEIKAQMMEFFGCHNFHRFKVTVLKDKFLRGALEKFGVESQEEARDEEAVATPSQSKLAAEAVIYPTKNVSAEQIAAFLRDVPQVFSIERLEDL